jgi:hypothetical protein
LIGLRRLLGSSSVRPTGTKKILLKKPSPKTVTATLRQRFIIKKFHSQNLPQNRYRNAAATVYNQKEFSLKNLPQKSLSQRCGNDL